MNKAEYHRYLASREWAVLKRKVRERSGGVCERCRLAPHEETHHVTYERLGHEWLQDLQGVCHACHQFVSGKSDHDPLVAYEPVCVQEQIDHDLQPSLTGQILAEGLTASTTDAVSAWNTKIQQLIERAKDNPLLVMRLAQIKLEINRRYYMAVRRGA